MKIFREENFISKEDQIFILNEINKESTWNKVSYLIDSRQSNILEKNNSKNLKHLFEIIDFYNKKISDYFYKNKILGNKIKCVEPSIYRYKKGYSLLPHIDDDWVKYSSIIYLNDTYSGGELNFLNLNLSIKPKERELIIFEQGHLHEVEIVKNGIRLTTANWWTDEDVNLEKMIEYSYDIQ